MQSANGHVLGGCPVITTVGFTGICGRQKFAKGSTDTTVVKEACVNLEGNAIKSTSKVAKAQDIRYTGLGASLVNKWAAYFAGARGTPELYKPFKLKDQTKCLVAFDMNTQAFVLVRCVFDANNRTFTEIDTVTPQAHHIIATFPERTRLQYLASPCAYPLLELAPTTYKGSIYNVRFAACINSLVALRPVNAHTLAAKELLKLEHTVVSQFQIGMKVDVVRKKKEWESVTKATIIAIEDGVCTVRGKTFTSETKLHTKTTEVRVASTDTSLVQIKPETCEGLKQLLHREVSCAVRQNTPYVAAGDDNNATTQTDHTAASIHLVARGVVMLNAGISFAALKKPKGTSDIINALAKGVLLPTEKLEHFRDTFLRPTSTNFSEHHVGTVAADPRQGNPNLYYTLTNKDVDLADYAPSSTASFLGTASHIVFTHVFEQQPGWQDMVRSFPEIAILVGKCANDYMQSTLKTSYNLTRETFDPAKDLVQINIVPNVRTTKGSYLPMRPDAVYRCFTETKKIKVCSFELKTVWAANGVDSSSLSMSTKSQHLMQCLLQAMVVNADEAHLLFAVVPFTPTVTHIKFDLLRVEMTEEVRKLVKTALLELLQKHTVDKFLLTSEWPPVLLDDKKVADVWAASGTLWKPPFTLNTTNGTLIQIQTAAADPLDLPSKRISIAAITAVLESNGIDKVVETKKKTERVFLRELQHMRLEHLARSTDGWFPVLQGVHLRRLLSKEQAAKWSIIPKKILKKDLPELYTKDITRDYFTF